MILAVIIGLFEALLKIITTIGSIYIMWKIILQAPSWLMKMVGIEGVSADIFADSLSNKLVRHSFQV
jgi:hypothetical protein